MIQKYLGIDPEYIIIGMAAITLIMFILVIVCLVKLSKLKKRYNFFMSGNDAKNLEDTLIYRLEQVDELIEANAANERDIEVIFKGMKNCFQKYGLVKYNAFNEMGGKLSFSLAMLNEDLDGYVMNAVHSSGGCFTYTKEIIAGQSVIQLAPEEQEALDQAINGNKNI